MFNLLLQWILLFLRDTAFKFIRECSVTWNRSINFSAIFRMNKKLRGLLFDLFLFETLHRVDMVIWKCHHKFIPIFNQRPIHGCEFFNCKGQHTISIHKSKLALNHFNQKFNEVWCNDRTEWIALDRMSKPRLIEKIK